MTQENLIYGYDYNELTGVLSWETSIEDLEADRLALLDSLNKALEREDTTEMAALRERIGKLNTLITFKKVTSDVKDDTINTTSLN